MLKFRNTENKKQNSHSLPPSKWEWPNELATKF